MVGYPKTVTNMGYICWLIDGSMPKYLKFGIFSNKLIGYTVMSTNFIT